MKGEAVVAAMAADRTWCGGRRACDAAITLRHVGAVR
jgi:hypothetical protein